MRTGAPSSFLSLVAMPRAPSSVLAPFVAMPFAPFVASCSVCCQNLKPEVAVRSALIGQGGGRSATPRRDLFCLSTNCRVPAVEYVTGAPEVCQISNHEPGQEEVAAGLSKLLVYLCQFP